MATDVVYTLKRGDAVKIGYSHSPASALRRYRAVKTASHEPLAIVAAELGSRAKEAAIHEALSDRRLSGEWFDDSDGAVSTLMRSRSNGLVMMAIHGDEEAGVCVDLGIAAEEQTG